MNPTPFPGIQFDGAGINYVNEKMDQKYFVSKNFMIGIFDENEEKFINGERTHMTSEYNI